MTPSTNMPPLEASNSPGTAQLAAQLFEHMQGLINFADTKAQLTLAADALLAAIITTMSQQMMANLLNSNALPLARIAGLLAVLMFVALLLSIYFALVVARPVLRVSGAKSNSLFYFGHIVQYSEKEFVEAFMSLTGEEAEAALLTQIYARSKIVWRKFNAIRRSLDFLVVALVLWIAAQILLAFTG